MPRLIKAGKGTTGTSEGAPRSHGGWQIESGIIWPSRQEKPQYTYSAIASKRVDLYRHGLG